MPSAHLVLPYADMLLALSLLRLRSEAVLRGIEHIYSVLKPELMLALSWT